MLITFTPFFSTLKTSLLNGANCNIYQGKKNCGILIMLREKNEEIIVNLPVVRPVFTLPTRDSKLNTLST